MFYYNVPYTQVSKVYKYKYFQLDERICYQKIVSV